MHQSISFQLWAAAGFEAHGPIGVESSQERKTRQTRNPVNPRKRRRSRRAKVPRRRKVRRTKTRRRNRHWVRRVRLRMVRLRVVGLVRRVRRRWRGQGLRRWKSWLLSRSPKIKSLKRILWKSEENSTGAAPPRRFRGKRPIQSESQPKDDATPTPEEKLEFLNFKALFCLWNFCLWKLLLQ